MSLTSYILNSNVCIKTSYTWKCATRIKRVKILNYVKIIIERPWQSLWSIIERPVSMKHYYLMGHFISAPHFQIWNLSNSNLWTHLWSLNLRSPSGPRSKDLRRSKWLYKRPSISELNGQLWNLWNEGSSSVWPWTRSDLWVLNFRTVVICWP